MQKQKTGKISIFSFLDIKLKFLMNQVENMSNLTQIKLKMRAIQFNIDSSSKR